ncbi:hypothetical protein [Geodermatophilus sp. SYSU D01036]
MIIVIVVLFILICGAASSSSKTANRLTPPVGTLSRSAVQGLIDQAHYGEEVILQMPATILVDERHPEGRGELVISTRKIHFVAYDETSYGVLGGFAFDFGMVLAVKRRAQDVLVLFVDDPEFSMSVGYRSGAVTTRFAFLVADPSTWLKCFFHQHEVANFSAFESYTDAELAEQPIVDWTQRIGMF